MSNSSSVLDGIGGIVASDVAALLSGGAVPQLAENLVADLLGPSGLVSAEHNLLAFVQQRLDESEGHASARGLARATLKQVENAMSPDSSGNRPAGVSAAQQAAVGQGLAANVALAYAACGQTFLDLIAAQAALETARGTAGEAAARAVREAAETVYEIAVENVTKAAAGVALQPISRVVIPAPAPVVASAPVAAPVAAPSPSPLPVAVIAAA